MGGLDGDEPDISCSGAGRRDGVLGAACALLSPFSTAGGGVIFFRFVASTDSIYGAFSTVWPQDTSLASTGTDQLPSRLVANKEMIGAEFYVLLLYYAFKPLCNFKADTDTSLVFLLPCSGFRRGLTSGLACRLLVLSDEKHENISASQILCTYVLCTYVVAAIRADRSAAKIDAIGESFGLHFFEPRYRLLISEVMAPYPVAFRRGDPIQLQGSGHSSYPKFIYANYSPLDRGAPAVIVEVRQCLINPNGTADVFLCPTSYIWIEDIRERPNSGALYDARAIRMTDRSTSALQRQNAEEEARRMAREVAMFSAGNADQILHALLQQLNGGAAMEESDEESDDDDGVVVVD